MRIACVTVYMRRTIPRADRLGLAELELERQAHRRTAVHLQRCDSRGIVISGHTRHPANGIVISGHTRHPGLDLSGLDLTGPGLGGLGLTGLGLAGLVLSWLGLAWLLLVDGRRLAGGWATRYIYICRRGTGTQELVDWAGIVRRRRLTQLQAACTQVMDESDGIGAYGHTSRSRT